MTSAPPPPPPAAGDDEDIDGRTMSGKCSDVLRYKSNDKDGEELLRYVFRV